MSRCQHDECQTAKECLVGLKPNRNSGKGKGAQRPVVEMDVVDRTHMPMGYRLARGFAIIKGGSV